MGSIALPFHNLPSSSLLFPCCSPGVPSPCLWKLMWAVGEGRELSVGGGSPSFPVKEFWVLEVMEESLSSLSYQSPSCCPHTDRCSLALRPSYARCCPRQDRGRTGMSHWLGGLCRAQGCGEGEIEQAGVPLTPHWGSVPHSVFGSSFLLPPRG